MLSSYFEENIPSGAWGRTLIVILSSSLPQFYLASKDLSGPSVNVKLALSLSLSQPRSAHLFLSSLPPPLVTCESKFSPQAVNHSPTFAPFKKLFAVFLSCVGLLSTLRPHLLLLIMTNSHVEIHI